MITNWRPATSELHAAIASVRGAAALSVETDASRSAPALLAKVNTYLIRETRRSSRWDAPRKLQRLDEIEAIARELAEALGLPAFRSRGNEILASGFQGFEDQQGNL